MTTHATDSLTSLTQLIETELPFIKAFYTSSEVFQQDFQRYFQEYHATLPKVEVNGVLQYDALRLTHDSAERLVNEAQAYYTQTEGFVKELLLNTPVERLVDLYSTAYLTEAELTLLVNIAKDELQHYPVPELFYARMDTSVDIQTGALNGVYEINANTPVMLFESTILQHHVFEAIKTDDTQDQYNEFFLTLERDPYLRQKRIAVAVDTRYPEDAITAEIISQLLTYGDNLVYYCDVTQLNHDLRTLNTPYYVDGVDEPMDAVFILTPWEDLVRTGKDILSLYKHSRVQFIQPAWAWFMGHKATQAIMYQEGLGHTKGLIPTYTRKTLEDFWETQPETYVKKPVIGRCSDSVMMLNRAQGAHQRMGVSVVAGQLGRYSAESQVYQPYVAPDTYQGRRIVMCPWFHKGRVVGLAVRTHQEAITSQETELFMPHILV